MLSTIPLMSVVALVTPCIRQLFVRRGESGQTHVEEGTRELLALLGKGAQLLQESVRDLLRRVDGSGGAGTEGRVDLGRLLEHIADDGLSRLEEGSEALQWSALIHRP